MLNLVQGSFQNIQVYSSCIQELIKSNYWVILHNMGSIWKTRVFTLKIVN